MNQNNKLLRFLIAVITLNLVPNMGWANLSKNNLNIIDKAISRIKNAQKAEELLASFRPVSEMINKLCIYKEGAKNKNSAQSEFVECQNSDLEPLADSIDALITRSESLMKNKKIGPAEREHLEILLKLKDNDDIDSSHMRTTLNEILAQAEASLGHANGARKEEIVNSIAMKGLPVKNERVFQDVYETLRNLVKWAQEHCKEDPAKGCSEKNYALLEPAMNKLADSVDRIIHNNADDADGNPRIFKRTRTAEIKEILDALHGSDASTARQNLETAIKDYSSVKIGTAIREFDHGNKEKAGTSLGSNRVQHVTNEVMHIFNYIKDLCGPDKECTSQQFNDIIQPAQIKLIGDSTSKGQIQTLVEEINAEIKALKKPSQEGKNSEKIQRLNQQKKALEELKKKVATWKENNIFKTAIAILSQKEQRKNKSKKSLLGSPLKSNSKRSQITPDDSELDLESILSKLSPEQISDLLRDGQLSSSSGSRFKQKFPLVPLPLFSHGLDLTSDENDLDPMDSRFAPEEEAFDLHQDDLTPEDMEKYFGASFNAKLDTSGTTPRVALLGKIPAECAQYFEFLPKTSSKIKGCEKSIGFQIVDQEQKGRSCIGEIAKKDGKLCGPAHLCVSLSKLANSQFTIAANKDITLQMFYRDASRDENDDRAMVCKPFPNSPNVAFESLNTKKARENDKRLTAIESRNQKILTDIHCQKDAIEIEDVSRPAVSLASDLGLITSSQAELENKKLNSRQLQYMVDELATAPKERLVELRSKLSDWAMAHSQDKEKINKAFYSIIQKHFVDRDFDEASMAITSALSLGQSSQEEHTLRGYQIEVEVAKLRGTAQNGYQGNPALMSQFNPLMQKLQRNATSSCSGRDARSMENCSRAMAAVQDAARIPSEARQADMQKMQLAQQMQGMMQQSMNPMMGNPMMGNPMMGNPMMGNPMMGNPMMGNPMMGNPMMGHY